jgi:hypothetical protein
MHMTLQHGIDHLKKHDSAKSRIAGAMLATILEQLGEDIPLPNGQEQSHKYAIDMPKGLALVALSDDKYVVPNLDPVATEAEARRKAGYSAEIVDFAQTFIAAGRQAVPLASENKGFLGHLKNKATVENSFTQEVEEIGHVLHYYSETVYAPGKVANELLSVNIFIDTTQEKDKSGLEINLLLKDGALSSIGFQAKSHDHLRLLTELLSTSLDEPAIIQPPEEHESTYAGWSAGEDFGGGMLKAVMITGRDTVKGVINVSSGALEYTIGTPRYKKQYTYDGSNDVFSSIKTLRNGQQMSGEDVSPHNFVDFAQSLLKEIPITKI